jgi:hypothetical protein
VLLARAPDGTDECIGRLSLLIAQYSGAKAILWEPSHPTSRPSHAATAAEDHRHSSGVTLWVTQAFFAETRALVTLAIVALPLAAASFLLLAPPTVFSREMSWDLLFNLEGAWNLWNGLQLHVDIHDPLGIVTFGLTALGFHITGIGPRAFLAGETLYAFLMLAAAICIFPRRLPPAAAAVATLYVVLLVLVPINLGDSIEIYSFAMSYNRLGWSALTLLFAMLFLAPRNESNAWLDQGIVFFLGALLFYLKITYFGVAVIAISAAILISPHVRRRAAVWLGVLGMLAILAAAPFNIPYWYDIFAALQTGAARLDIGWQLKNLATSKDTAVILIDLVCLLFLRRAGVSWCRVASAIFIIGCGAFILSQNQQFDGIVLYVVVALLLFDSARMALERQTRLRPPEAALLLAAVLIAPAIDVASMGASLAGYYVKATASDQYVVEDTNLRGLAIPPEHPNLIGLFSGSRMAPGLLNAARLQHPRYELTQAEYLKTILEAAGTIRTLMSSSGTKQPRVGLLDAVNPLPFMLGLQPPGGRQLWFDSAFPWPRAEEFLGGLDYVFVPKFPSDSASTHAALEHYSGFLAQHFRRTETESWILFQRSEPLPAPAPGSVAASTRELGQP